MGEWSTDLGSKSRFPIQLPLLQPSLKSTVVERQVGLVVWDLMGFSLGAIAGNVPPKIAARAWSTLSPSISLNGQTRDLLLNRTVLLLCED